MKRRRKTNKNPSAILSADWHIRGDRPRSRTDDFVLAMKTKVEFIFALAKTHNIPIYIAGDLGHRFTWPNHLLSWFLELLNNNDPYMTTVFCIPGQHDLRNHRIEEIENGGLGVIKEGSPNIDVDHVPFETLNIIHFPSYQRNIGMIHKHIWSGESDDHWPGQDSPKGIDLLKKYNNCDLIVSGDNHKSFVHEHQGRLLVNPGSLMRTSAAQISHRPRVYLYYAEDNTVEAVYLPIEKGVIDRSHIDNEKDKEEKRMAYIQRVNTKDDMSLDFEDNMERYFGEHRTSKRVKEKVERCL